MSGCICKSKTGYFCKRFDISLALHEKIDQFQPVRAAHRFPDEGELIENLMFKIILAHMFIMIAGRRIK